MEAQARPWRQVKALSNHHKCPILCGGDVFNHWNPPAEIINFAMRELPRMYAIPGNHDLPYHDYSQIRRSGYWTLVECGTLIDLKPGKMEPVSDHFAVMGFPWGTPPKPWVLGQPLQGFNVALIHKHVWSKKTGFPGADQSGYVTEIRKSLAGYRVVLASDNHKTMLSSDDSCTIFNIGGFMRTRTDEQNHRPCVGLVWSDGTVTREYLDISKDVLLDRAGLIESTEARKGDFEDFLQSVRDIGNASADYIEAVWEAAERKKIDKETRKQLAKCLEEKK